MGLRCSAKDGTPIDTVNIANSNAFGQDPIFSNDGKRIIIPIGNGQAYAGTFDKDYSKLPNFSIPVNLDKAYSFVANSGKIKPLYLPLADITSGSPINTSNEIFLGNSKGYAAVFDLSTGEIKTDYIRHEGSIIALAATEDGNTLATASNQGSIKIWNRSNLKEPIFLIGENDPENPIKTQKIKFLKNGSELLSINDKSAKLWDVRSFQLITNYNLSPTESLGYVSENEKYKTF